MDALGIEDWRKKSFIPILYMFSISKALLGFQKLKDSRSLYSEGTGIPFHLFQVPR